MIRISREYTQNNLDTDITKRQNHLTYSNSYGLYLELSVTKHDLTYSRSSNTLFI